MAINANRLVSISPRVIASGSADLETNGLILTKNNLIPASTPAISFSSAAAVSAMFGAESQEADLAQQYFTGVLNQQSPVRTLFFGRRVDATVPAWVRSGSLKLTLVQLKEIVDGAMNITIGNTVKNVTGVDLSGAASMSEAATTIATAIGAVTGSYDSNLNAFTFTTTATGKEAQISMATPPASGTDLATAICLTAETGAVVSAGSDALTEAANMNAICNVSRNWVGFTTAWECTLEEAQAYAAWSDLDTDYSFVCWSSDQNMLNPLTSANTVIAQLGTDYQTVSGVYGTAYDAVFALAVGASINWSAVQGIKTWFAKSASGLPASVLGDTEADALDALRCNYFGEFATRNSEFKFFNRGYLLGTQFGFIDTLYGNIWLRARLQRSIMDGFGSVNRAPYNARGYALVSAWLLDPISAAKRNGVIDTGLAITESQKQQIIQEVGQDITQELYANGYWFEITDPDGSTRAERRSPSLSFYYCYAGSIQNLEFPLTAIL